MELEGEKVDEGVGETKRKGLQLSSVVLCCPVVVLNTSGFTDTDVCRGTIRSHAPLTITPSSVSQGKECGSRDVKQLHKARNGVSEWLKQCHEIYFSPINVADHKSQLYLFAGILMLISPVRQIVLFDLHLTKRELITVVHRHYINR